MDILGTPVIFTIFGATGNLAEYKLFKALYWLFSKRLLPDKFYIVGFSRRPFSDQAFRDLVRSWLLTSDRSDDFFSKILYQQGNFDDIDSYRKLGDRLNSLDKELGVCSHKIFHLSISPFLYENVLKGINQSGLHISCVDSPGKTRVLIEKPIGHNLPSSISINNLLDELFLPDQVFRVDHYLMKSGLWNQLSPQNNFLWPWPGRLEDIESLEIDLLEKDGIQGRGEFYDPIGATKDVVQNHCLQALALAMSVFSNTDNTNNVSDVGNTEKAVLSKSDILESLCVGPGIKIAQYEGYKNEKGVKPDSKTETFISLPLHSSLPGWKNIKLKIVAGKAMPENQFLMKIKSRKNKGLNKDVKEDIKIVDFKNYQNIYKKTEEEPENYQGVYYHALHGHTERFVSRAETEASFRLIDSIPLNQPKLQTELQIYKIGDIIL